MLTAPTAAAPSAQLCPLDGNETEEFSDGFVVCTRCREVLEPGETVSVATAETWAAYLIAGGTDTDPSDAPLGRLNENAVCPEIAPEIAKTATSEKQC